MDEGAPLHVAACELPEAETVFGRLGGRPGRFWLDSSGRTGEAGRVSMLGCEPAAVLRSWGATWQFRQRGGPVVRGRGEPLEELERRLGMYRVKKDSPAPFPFCGGAVGFLAYDLGRVIEPSGFTGGRRDAGGDPPDMHWAWYDAAAVWDHALRKAWLVGVGWSRPAAEAVEWLRGLISGGGACDQGSTGVPPVEDHGSRAGRPCPLASNFTRAGYMAAVEGVRERIAAGEVYQINLAQRFECPLPGPPDRIYLNLRRLNPAPMAAYLEAGDWTVLSSSPERFLEGRLGGGVRTFPIKGTRPRGAAPAEDGRLRAELESSAKERAELLMIVDLLRNDLGRICAFGSVRAARHPRIESFATVHHLVGEVQGELKPEVGPAAILRAVFPGGSITGAPKVTAMRLIEALEPDRRGLFSGAIGYWSACGRFDLAIAIRTIVCGGGRARFHVGAGIVWDSDPAAEYEETLAKGRALAAALGAGFPDEEGPG